MSEEKCSTCDGHGSYYVEIPALEIVTEVECLDCKDEENAAVKIAEKRIYARCGIGDGDVIDNEFYCEKINET